MSLKVIGETFQSDGSLTGNSGARAEKTVEDIIQEVYRDKQGYLYINKEIPHSNFQTKGNLKPDFIIPALTEDGKNLRIIVIECKSDKIVFRDGSTRNKDVYRQVLSYRDAIKRCFGFFKKEIIIECYAVFPNAPEISMSLSDYGRNDISWLSGPEELKKALLKITPVCFAHTLLPEVNKIYDNRKVLLDARIKHGDKKLSAHVKPFGGIHGFKGLAGTGKTYQLGMQILKDAVKEKRDLLYATHNKNLVKEFIQFMEEKTGLRCKEKLFWFGGPEKTVKYIELENNSNIYFINTDAFPTRFFTFGLDGRKHGGTLYKICNSHGIGKKDEDSNPLSEKQYTSCRVDLIKKLKEDEFQISERFKLFDGIYLDEFQDVLADDTRLRIFLPFVARNKKQEPNIFFAEDPLQSSLSWSDVKKLHQSQQDEDDGIASTVSYRKDLKTYTELFGRKVIPTTLREVYRTPETIFKASFSLLKDAFKKGKYEILFDENNSTHLKFKRYGGAIQFLEKEQVDAKVHEKKQQITFKSTTISHLENKQSLNAQYHHLECRGCEWDNVFIYLHTEFLNNPNYLYMLMCRTKDYLALAGDETQIKQMKELLQKSKQ